MGPGPRENDDDSADDDDSANDDDSATDGDGDGYDATVDCDDGDPTVFPGEDEDCDDGVDSDCDDTADALDSDCLPVLTSIEGWSSQAGAPGTAAAVQDLLLELDEGRKRGAVPPG